MLSRTFRHAAKAPLTREGRQADCGGRRCRLTCCPLAARLIRARSGAVESHAPRRRAGPQLAKVHSCPPVVGSRGCWAPPRTQLMTLLEQVRGRRSGVLVLRGEPGVGKTALLEYAAESASALRVVRAVGVESEMELAFAPLHQLCSPMFDRLDQLPSPQRDALATTFGLRAGAVPDRFLVGLATLAARGRGGAAAVVRGRRRAVVDRPRAYCLRGAPPAGRVDRPAAGHPEPSGLQTPARAGSGLRDTDAHERLVGDPDG